MIKRVLHWAHNFFDLHDYVYSNQVKVPPCTRYCTKCESKQTMVGNNAGIWWMDDNKLDDMHIRD